MICPNCQHEQAAGKFCGKCGADLLVSTGGESGNVAAPTEAAAGYSEARAAHSPLADNQHVEKVKVQSKQYWNYSLQYLKKPGTIVDQPAGQFVNALITMGIFVIFFSLAVYRNLSMVLSPVGELGSAFGSTQSLTPSIFSVLFNTALILGIVFALAAACIYVVNKFAGPNESFKSIVTSFGTLLLPSAALVLVAYVLLLISSMTFGNFLLFASFGLAISIMPLYLITALVRKAAKPFDSFYAYLSYIVLFSIGSIIVMTIFFDSTIGRYIDGFDSLL